MRARPAAGRVDGDIALSFGAEGRRATHSDRKIENCGGSRRVVRQPLHPYGALVGLTGDRSGCRRIGEFLKGHREVAVDLLYEFPGMRCFRPEATFFYLHPNVTGLIERGGLRAFDELRRAAPERMGVSLCTRLHCGRALPREKESYMRFACSGINAPPMEEVLGRLKAWAEA